MLRVLDLFSGIGGFSLGLERTGGFETVAFCEIFTKARAVLAKHWPEVPCFPNIEELRSQQVEELGRIDVVCGGFPCQPFSSAARGRNIAPDLWPHMARVIRDAQPKIVIVENVKRPPIERAAESIRGMGLSCITVRIRAADVGADHERDRWWAIAHPHAGCELLVAVHAEVAKLREIRERIWGAEAYRAAIRVSDGLPAGLGDPGLFGNAVLPLIPELIGRAILASHEPAQLRNTIANPRRCHPNGFSPARADDVVPFHDEPNSPEAQPHHGA